jgi:hypothetical protein
LDNFGSAFGGGASEAQMQYRQFLFEIRANY